MRLLGLLGMQSYDVQLACGDNTRTPHVNTQVYYKKSVMTKRQGQRDSACLQMDKIM